MRHKLLLILGLMAAFAMVAAACGDDDDDTAAESGDTGGETAEGDTGGGGDGGPTITLVANAWTASALNAEIASQLIEANLGNEVEILDIDENTMFAGLSSGELDAVLELWPSGIVDDEQAFLDDGSVVNIGELGAVGRIGWYVPQYVLDANPELATWEGFLDPEVASLFATAETGDLGRFLATDPSYSQYDEPIVEQLGLPFEVIYSGSETATIAELDTRFQNEEPVLMYWWTPTAAVAAYNLVKVELPAYSDECYADPTTVACDYPEDVLIKLASAGLAEKDPEVYAFLTAFTLTNDDQLSMLPDVELEGRDVAEVAAEWIAANEATWSAWFGA